VSNRGRVRRRTSLLVTLLIALCSARGDAAEASGSGPRLKACLLKTLSTETPVNQLGIHPDSHLVAYTFAGVIGRAGGQGDRLFHRSRPRCAALAIPALCRHEGCSVRATAAFVQSEKGVSTLRIGALDGSDSQVCTSSSAYLRPLAFSSDERLLIAMSSRGPLRRCGSA
jgi:hypothetical protein